MSDQKIIEQKLFSKIQKNRIDAVSDVVKLPNVQAKRLLVEGLSHWDRMLREQCAVALVKIFGSKAAVSIVAAYGTGQLSPSKTADLLSKCDCRTAFRCLKKIGHSNNCLVRSAASSGIDKQTCQEALFYRWKIYGFRNPTKFAQLLNQVPDKNLIQFVKIWLRAGHPYLLSLLVSGASRKYIETRGLAYLIQEFEDEILTRRALRFNFQ
jgi:hypothetical protein